MSFALIWLAALIATSWAGWLVSGRTEAATLFMGIAMALLSALELLGTPAGHGQRRMPAATLTISIGLIFAGVFDRLDIHRADQFLDWVTGFLAGAFLSGMFLLPLALRDRRTKDSFRAGDFPQPHWDAVWISIALAAGLLAHQEIEQWHAARGIEVDVFLLLPAVSLAGLLICMLVQLSRMGRLYPGRLFLSALCPVLMLFLPGMSDAPRWIMQAFLFSLLCMAGGGYPLRRPSGTLTDGWHLMRHWAVTGALIFVMFQNITGSLLNRTVAEVIASHQPLSPLPEESFTRLMERDSYLWHNERLTVSTRTGANTPKLYLAERDRFSFLQRGDSEGSSKQGDGMIGLPENPGVVVTFRDRQARVVHVVPGSPAEKAGVARGWRVSLGHTADGTGKRYLFTEPGKDARPVTGSTDKGKQVESRIDRSRGIPVGYLFFDEFHPSVIKRLNEAFAKFKEAGIKELVIDLRYNPGGNLSVLSHLGNLIAGNSHAGEVFYKTSNNLKYTDANESFYFKPHNSGIDIKRIFILQSADTCSASELLSVGFNRYLPVISFGEVSCGKPVGMAPLQYGDLRFVMLNFSVSDAKGMGLYHEGLVPDCLMKDDISQSFRLGTKEDPMFNAAMEYIGTGKCEPI